MDLNIRSLYDQLEARAIPTSVFIPLVSSILSKAADAEIWDHITTLEDKLETFSPLQHDASLLQHPDSRHIYTTNQIQGAEDTMKILKEALRKELMGTVFEDVQGFYERFFEKPLWASKCQKICDSYVNRKDQNSFRFPDDPTENNVWQWIKSVQTKFIESYQEPPVANSSNKPSALDQTNSSKKRNAFPLRGQKFRANDFTQIAGGPCFRQVDFFIKSRSHPRGTRHHWRDILVLGEFCKSSSNEWIDKFLQLAVYMREVFTAQPLRKFVHGFLLLGTKLQLWVFDRSGPYSTGFIEIGEKPEVFIYVITAYMLMSDEELGMDTSVRHEETETVITVTDAETQEPRTLILEAEPFVKQRAIVSRGTTCYRAKDGSFVLKISWRAVDRLCEVSLLVQARNVRGVARLIGSRNDSKISDLRKDLTITSEMMRDVYPDETLMTTNSEPIWPSPTILVESTEQSRSGKRKSRPEVSDGNNGDNGEQSSKKTRVSNIARTAQISAATLSDQGNKDAELVEIVRRSSRISSRKSIEYFAPSRKSGQARNSESSKSGSKRRRNAEPVQDANSAVPKRDMKRLRISNTAGGTVLEDGSAPNPSQVAQATAAPVNDGEKTNPASPKLPIAFRDRQKTFIATEPRGRSIGEETTALELLRGIRDAISAHRSLFMDAKILHRDISINNIILTDPAVNNGRYGLLIDLDLAISLNDAYSEGDAQIMTGTMEFIALGILEANIFNPNKGYKHTFRHDLESFFYVLISACIRFGRGNENSDHTQILARWYTGKVWQMYDAKNGAMLPKHFENIILNHFSLRFNCVRELAKRFRIILFDRSWGVCTIADLSPNEMYDLILQVFDEEIEKIKLAEKLDELG